ncbi:uncharacterized protein LOC133285665 [Gastrolobium bilobum]|uniref:uncharacterized protein LOC133285665 n=1 Tax=Gastrolobium bilobum TaxID=150636 RepID=UPI002AB04221|nr:uncharacterized protein LOC133285665 [Gastrolobium bilobum]
MEKYNKLVNEITNFTQQPGKTLCAAWTRYQELIRKCPQYDLPDTKKVRVFYNGMTPECRMIVNGAAGGTIGKKTADETLELLDLMARNENASMAAAFPSVQPKKGILQLGNNDASLAEQKSDFTAIGQFECQAGQDAALNIQAEPFQVNGIWYDPRPPQNIQGYQRNQNGGQGNNFQRKNQGSGLDYKSNNYLQPPPLPQKEPSELEKAMIQLSKTTNDNINETRAYHKNQDASIRNLETQIGQLSRQLAERSQEKSDAVSKEQCNVITTRNEELEKEKVEVSTRKDEQAQKDEEEINIPFADTLEQMPSYAKFLKETLSKKRKLTEDEPVTLTEECSVILQKNMPPKLKDPGSFSIPCIIGKTTIERVLCDLGASVNGELIMRVDGEQAIFKVLINEAPPLPAPQPKNQVNYIVEKKVEERNKKEIHQWHEGSKPNVKMEKPKGKEKHVRTKFKVSEKPHPYPHAYEYNHGGTQILSKGIVSSLSPSYQPP